MSTDIVVGHQAFVLTLLVIEAAEARAGTEPPQNAAGLTLAGATDVVVAWRKPDKTEGSWPAVVAVAGSVGTVPVLTVAGGLGVDFDQAGPWSLWAEWTDAEGRAAASFAAEFTVAARGAPWR